MESTISDFWRLVYQTEAASVVMLGPFEEEGHKCPQYFPEKFCNYKDMFVNTKRVSSNKVKRFLYSELQY